MQHCPASHHSPDPQLCAHTVAALALRSGLLDYAGGCCSLEKPLKVVGRGLLCNCNGRGGGGFKGLCRPWLNNRGTGHANPPTHPQQKKFCHEETESLVQVYVPKEGWEETRDSPVAQGQSLGSRAKGIA